MRTSSSRIRSALISLIDAELSCERAPCRRLNLELERGGEAHRAQHAQPIFGKALRRIADRADDARLEISAAADVIDDFVPLGIEEHPVDREVASPGIFFRAGEVDLRRSPPVEVGAIGTKRRDLELQSAFEDDDHAEVRPYRVGPRRRASAPVPAAHQSRYRYPSARRRAENRAPSRRRNTRHDQLHANAGRWNARFGPARDRRTRTTRARRELPSCDYACRARAVLAAGQLLHV